MPSRAGAQLLDQAEQLLNLLVHTIQRADHPLIRLRSSTAQAQSPQVAYSHRTQPLLRAQVTLAASCMLGLSINHSTFVCTRYNDALTTSVAGSAKVSAVNTPCTCAAHAQARSAQLRSVKAV